MALEGFAKILRLQNLLVYSKIFVIPPVLQNNTLKEQLRLFGDRCHCEEEKKEASDLAKKCQNKTCPRKEKKKGFFSRLFGDEEKKVYPQEMCRIKYNQECKEDPDLSIFGGKAFKTCGRGAYVIQKDNLPVEEEITSKEDLLIRKIEAPLGSKYEIEDPMPSFRSVEQRMLDLQDRKLHPYYKRFQGLRKKPPTKEMKELYHKYTNVNFDKIEAEEIPKRIKFNKELLDKKNIFAEFKRVEPPKQLIGRMVEMKRNEKPTLEKKPQKVCREKPQPAKERQVFDTLEQKGDLF